MRAATRICPSARSPTGTVAKRVGADSCLRHPGDPTPTIGRSRKTDGVKAVLAPKLASAEWPVLFWYNWIRGGRSAGCCSGRTARPARGGRDRPPLADSDLSKSGLGVAGAGWLTPDNLNPVRQETLNPRLLDLGCVPYWHAWVSLCHSDGRTPSFSGSELAGFRGGWPRLEVRGTTPWCGRAGRTLLGVWRS